MLKLHEGRPVDGQLCTAPPDTQHAEERRVLPPGTGLL